MTLTACSLGYNIRRAVKLLTVRQIFLLLKFKKTDKYCPLQQPVCQAGEAMVPWAGKLLSTFFIRVRGGKKPLNYKSSNKCLATIGQSLLMKTCHLPRKGILPFAEGF